MCVNGNIIPGINFNGTQGGQIYNDVAVPYSQASGTIGYRWKPGRTST